MKRVLNTYVCLLALMTLFTGCNDATLKTGEFRINGKLRFLRDGYVKLIVREGETLMTLDSSLVGQDSTFVLSGQAEDPRFAQIDFYGKQQEFVVLSEGVIAIEADGNRPGGYFSATGTEELELQNHVKTIHQSLLDEVQTDKQLYTIALAQADYERADSLKMHMERSVNRHHEELMSFIDSIGTGYLSGVFALNLLDYRTCFEYLVETAQKISEKQDLKPYEIEWLSNFNNNKAQMMAAIDADKRKAEIEKNLRIGAEFPEIDLLDPDGKNQKLSSLRGKYVLVDFWAAWCRPCRMENPNLVEAYKKYNPRGFEIYGVSLDSKKEAWIDAIAKDRLTWTQVSDLKQWNSVVVRDFNINSIPANFLLDPQGRIIATNLRGPGLEAKLEEIFAST